MKLKGVETFKLNEIIHVPQAVKNIMSILRLISKGSTMGKNKDKTAIKKIGISMTMNARKGKMIAQCSLGTITGLA